ncbi:MAG TPA: hypothetical protein VGU90_15025, partial [Terriglobales bacterium]|nr:hypothetical protein [Terriglobales bacterium]
MRTRAADVDTAFEQINEYAMCTFASEFNAGHLIRMVIRAPGLGVLNEIGNTSVQLFFLASSSQAQELTMLDSNKVQIAIVDPVNMPRKWGERIKGLSVSLALDKDEYDLGEDVPLRIAVENFSAARVIESGELPCSAGVSVNIADSAGQEVTSFLGGGE